MNSGGDLTRHKGPAIPHQTYRLSYSAILILSIIIGEQAQGEHNSGMGTTPK
jgi:hypothetical protein